jgi:hypothetical protein
VDWLKLKSFVVLHRFTDEEVFDKRFQKKVAEIIKAGKPLNDFLSSALE